MLNALLKQREYKQLKDQIKSLIELKTILPQFVEIKTIR